MPSLIKPECGADGGRRCIYPWHSDVKSSDMHEVLVSHLARSSHEGEGINRISIVVVAIAVVLSVGIAVLWLASANDASAKGKAGPQADPTSLIKAAEKKAEANYPDAKFVSMVVEGVDRRGRVNATKGVTTFRFTTNLAAKRSRPGVAMTVCILKVKFKDGRMGEAVPVHGKCEGLRATPLPRCTAEEAMRKALKKGLFYYELSVLSYYGATKPRGKPSWSAFSGDSYITVPDDC